MADTQESSSSQNSGQTWEALGQLKRQTGIGLLVVAALFALIPILMAFKYRGDYLSVSIWGAGLALVALMAGLWRLLAQPARLTPADATRLLILVLGGLGGLLTVLFLGLGLALRWWSTVTGGWEAWQGKEGWHIWVILFAFVGGLAVMFLSLQLARTDERSNSAFRRLLYGYNAVLTGLLLFLILVVLNVLSYIPWGPFAWLNQTFNWSESSIYSLSSKSENVLDGLTKPVKVYVILSQRNEWYRPTRALMDNVRRINPKVQVKYLSPEADREEIERLAKDYKIAVEREGLLVAYGSEPNIETRFIKNADLFSADADMMMGGRSKQSFFKGEAALMNELNSLDQGKEKPVIYLTQGNGELDMSDSSQNPRSDVGLSAFKDRLQSNNYTVKGLQFTQVEGVQSKKPDLVIAKRVPADAALVIIAGPTKRFETYAIDALKEYMQSADPKAVKGKLIAMLGAVVTPEKTMLQTGLEPMLAELGVELKNDRLLRLPSASLRDPEQILVITNPEPSVQAQNPILSPFNGIGFLFRRCRPVAPKTPAGPGPQQHFRADSLMVTFPNQDLLQESNLAADAMQLLIELDRTNKLGQRISRDVIPVAVAVSETTGAGAGPDPHAFMNPGDSKPRLVVFGDSAMACNNLMTERAGGAGVYYDLLASTIAWLREKPTGIGIEPKKSDFYALNPEVNVGRMVWLPALLMVVTVVGLGTGVWVVRRK
jgi:hypothetical protein